MEATGVYGEQLCYYLAARGFRLAVEPPHQVKRAAAWAGHKNDRVDSQKLAVYAARYHDELHFWQPKKQILEQLAVLLSTREQFTKQKTANRNFLKTIKRKHHQTPLANELFESHIDSLRQSIQRLDHEIQQLVEQDQSFHHMVALLKSVPGVGMLMAANLLVLTEGFTRGLYYKKLAAYLGVCPYEHRSGKSVFKKPRSAGHGPARLRKLLRLAALSVRTHHRAFESYFYRKVAEGKPENVVINNIANKLLRIICAIMNSKLPYIENYRSIHPMLLKNA
jgi:transposase